MKLLSALALTILMPGSVLADHHSSKDKDGFFELFNGKSLEGWTINESPESWKVSDGKIIVKGPRSHLFYTGKVNKAEFKNFEAKLQVLTKKGANAGFYFHTKFQKNL